MDFVDRIVGHDIWFTQRLLDRAGNLPAESLDRRVLEGWKGWSGEASGSRPAVCASPYVKREI